MDEKRRFFKAVLSKVGPLNAVDVFLSIGYRKLDVALVIQPRRDNDAGRKCLRELDEDVKAIRDQVTTWLYRRGFPPFIPSRGGVAECV